MQPEGSKASTMLLPVLGGVLAALVAGAALADSVAGPVQLAPTADCQASASVQWSFTYTQNPQREFGRITNLNGTVIGSFSQPSPLTGGSFNGVWTQFINVQQPPNTLIGSYGGAGDNPPTAANTAEFFVLYNCSTRQVLYRCTGNLGTCPQTASGGLARITESIPAQSPASLAAMLLVLLGSGAWVLRRRAVLEGRRR
jgi:hypothetical protein